MARQPTLFIPHGGGPLPLLGDRHHPTQQTQSGGGGVGALVFAVADHLEAGEDEETTEEDQDPLEAADQGGAEGDLYSAATVQEEVGLRGAVTSTYAVDPDVAIAVDVSHGTDYPDVDKRRHGDYRLGKGPVLFRGANVNPKVFELLTEAATGASIGRNAGSTVIIETAIAGAGSTSTSNTSG